MDAGLGGSSWTVKQVRELRAMLWATETDFRERLGNEVASLKAETAVIEALCMETGIRLMYRTVGPDCWDLVLEKLEPGHRKTKPVRCHDHLPIAVTEKRASHQDCQTE